MDDGIVGAVAGMSFLTVINIVTLAFFYGKLCGKVDANTWKIAQLWRRVFNNNDEEEYHESRRGH